MKYLNKLGLILGAGGMSVVIFSLAACGEDTPDGGTAGSGTAGSTAGTSAGNGTAGTSAGMTNGGSSSGSGGSSAGSAPKAGAGGMAGSAMGGSAGSGGAAGGGGKGGGGGTGGGAPSADCSKWCSGANGLIAQCAGMLPTVNDSEAKCLALCNDDSADGAKGLACWNNHLSFIVGGQAKGTHCPHAAGTKGNGQCNEVPGQ